MRVTGFLLFLFLISGLSSCSKQPQAIQFGVDDCDYCKMLISDERYGAEIVTKKGRIYKFDDLHCLSAFIEDDIVPTEQIHATWLVDFTNSAVLIEAENSYLLQHEALQSPMGSNTAVFSSEEVLNSFQSEYSGKTLTWEEFFNSK